mgnify:CR=1 FL=1
MSRLRCPKIGKGTEEDPIRPDLSIPEIAILHRALDNLRASKKEIQNVTFYIVQVEQDLGDSFEVEIVLPKELPPNVPDEVRKAWQAIRRRFDVPANISYLAGNTGKRGQKF